MESDRAKRICASSWPGGAEASRLFGRGRSGEGVRAARSLCASTHSSPPDLATNPSRLLGVSCECYTSSLQHIPPGKM